MLIQEHILKSAAYLLIALLFAKGTHESATLLFGKENEGSVPHFVVNGLSFYLALQLIFSEFKIMMQRNKLPKGYLGWPMSETLRWIIGNNNMKLSKEKVRQYGDTFMTSIFFSPVVIFTTDEDVTWLWNTQRKNLTTGSWPDHWKMLLGRGSVPVASGKYHRMLRRALEPAFAPASVKDYLPRLDSILQIELQKIAASTTSNENFLSSFVRFKVVAMKLLLGSIFEQVDDAGVERVSHDFAIWSRGFAAIVPFEIPGLAMGRGMAARRRILSYCRELVENFQQKEKLQNGEQTSSSTLLGRIMSAIDDDGKPLSLEILSNNILVMLFAGHDTTANSMGTILHFLHVYPEVQDALREEAKTFTEPVTFDQLRDAPVLNAFLQETLRIVPPVGFAFVETKQDLPYKDYTIPKGMKMGYNILLGGHNEKHYPNPTEFRIERFLPDDHPFVVKKKEAGESMIKRSTTNYDEGLYKSSFRIFGGGNHSCLGAQFAKLETRLFLVRILQRYNLDVGESKLRFFPFHAYHVNFRLQKRDEEEAKHQSVA